MSLTSLPLVKLLQQLQQIGKSSLGVIDMQVAIQALFSINYTECWALQLQDMLLQPGSKVDVWSLGAILLLEVRSGTTHRNRQAHLAENQPDSPECLEKHLAELQKAADKAKLKLEQAKEKAFLEKDASSSLGKDEKPSGSSKRKHSKERNVLKKTKAKEKKEEEPLEKGELRRSRKAKDGTCEQQREVKEEPESEEEEGWAKKKANKAPKKSLEKDKEEKSLEKDKEDGSLEKNKKPSEKDLASSPSVDREGLRLRPAPPKPVVVVDWHETLEMKMGRPWRSCLKWLRCTLSPM